MTLVCWGPVGVLAPVDIQSACSAKVADTQWQNLLWSHSL